MTNNLFIEQTLLESIDWHNLHYSNANILSSPISHGNLLYTLYERLLLCSSAIHINIVIYCQFWIKLLISDRMRMLPCAVPHLLMSEYGKLIIYGFGLHRTSPGIGIVFLTHFEILICELSWLVRQRSSV
jgi:hypothetical protein